MDKYENDGVVVETTGNRRYPFVFLQKEKKTLLAITSLPN